MTTDKTTKITQADLEKKLHRFQGEVQGTVDEKKPTAVAIGTGIGVVLLILVFLIGKRSGKRRSTVVEIRRI